MGEIGKVSLRLLEKNITLQDFDTPIPQRACKNSATGKKQV